MMHTIDVCYTGIRSGEDRSGEFYCWSCDGCGDIHMETCPTEDNTRVPSEPWAVDGEKNYCEECSLAKKKVALAEHEKPTKQTEEKPCSMTPEFPTT